MSGPSPLAVNWAFATSPDYAQANTVLWGNGGGASSCSSEPSLFFRVRAGYDNDLGPWSQPASFTIPCPVQFMPNSSNATAASQCPFKSGSSAECLAWEPVRDAVGYFVRVAPTWGSAPCSGASAWGDRFHGWHRADGWRQHSRPERIQCIVVGKAVTPTVWCALWKGSTQMSTGGVPFNLAAGSMQRWDVRQFTVRMAVGSMVAGFSDDMVSIARLGAAEDRFIRVRSPAPNNCPATGSLASLTKPSGARVFQALWLSLGLERSAWRLRLPVGAPFWPAPERG